MSAIVRLLLASALLGQAAPRAAGPDRETNQDGSGGSRRRKARCRETVKSRWRAPGAAHRHLREVRRTHVRDGRLTRGSRLRDHDSAPAPGLPPESPAEAEGKC